MLRSYRASGGHCAEIENSFGQSEQLIWGLHRQRRYFDLILFTTCWKYKWHRLPGSTATLHITTAIECCYLVCYIELMAVIIIGAYLVHDLRTWKFLNQHIFFLHLTGHKKHAAQQTEITENTKIPLDIFCECEPIFIFQSFSLWWRLEEKMREA